MSVITIKQIPVFQFPRVKFVTLVLDCVAEFPKYKKERGEPYHAKPMLGIMEMTSVLQFLRLEFVRCY